MLLLYYYTIFLLRRSFLWNTTRMKGTVLRVFLPLILHAETRANPNVVTHMYTRLPSLPSPSHRHRTSSIVSNFRADTPTTRWRVIGTIVAFACMYIATWNDRWSWCRVSVIDHRRVGRVCPGLKKVLRKSTVYMFELSRHSYGNKFK